MVPNTYKINLVPEFSFGDIEGGPDSPVSGTVVAADIEPENTRAG
jgi:hypothetical protein